MTRPLASSNDDFLIDFACSFVYLTAIVEAITPVAMVQALWEALIPMYALMTQA